jgi:hypothetical protein
LPRWNNVHIAIPLYKIILSKERDCWRVLYM